MQGEDLYNTSDSIKTTTQQSTSDTVFFGFNGVDLDLSAILYYVNIYALAWTIIFSLIYIYDFFYYRIWFPDGEVEREQKGVKSINEAVSIWWTYAISLAFYTGFLFQTGFTAEIIGYVTLVAYFFKIVVIDLPDIPVIGKFFGPPGAMITNFILNFWQQIGNLLKGFIDSIAQVFFGGSSSSSPKK